MKKFKLNFNSVRIICTLLVIANHTSPLLSLNANVDFVLTHILARVAVPFFLMIIGYYSLERLINHREDFFNFVKRISIMYLFSVLLYLPLTLYVNNIKDIGLLSFIKLIFLDGSMYHLWYFPALILGATITILLIKYTKRPTLYILALYIIGIFGDSYYGVIEQTAIFKPLYTLIFSIFEYTRNGLFYVPIFLYLGYDIKKKKQNLYQNQTLIIVLSLFGLIVEGLYLYIHQHSRHDSMYFFLIPLVYFSFLSLSKKENIANKRLSFMTMLIYIIHPMIIVFLRGVSKVLNVSIIIENSFLFFILVSLLSFMFAYIVDVIKNHFIRNQTLPYQRVYREINAEHLRHNLKEIESLKHEDTEIMAVIKADAYGHGSVEIAKILEANNIKIFAVASLEEAIELRHHKIKGDILILGYTRLEHIQTVIDYNLIQTIVNYDYAVAISELKLKKKLKSHIKINTGMNRLGEEYYNVKLIKEMYEMKSLNVLGIFSHLAVADSSKLEDVAFTKAQIEKFDACISELEALKIDVKKKHLQGSYGFSNYPHLHYDYIRMGIMLYGVKSSLDDDLKLNLKPVLTLKSKITLIRDLKDHDCVSYGRTWQAEGYRKIATVSIGYGDGLSRSLSNQNYEVLINGQLCPIVGRICMDQIMVDVTDCEDIKLEDDVVIFGEHNPLEILAKKQGTITNEVLSALTRRIEY